MTERAMCRSTICPVRTACIRSTESGMPPPKYAEGWMRTEMVPGKGGCAYFVAKEKRGDDLG